MKNSMFFLMAVSVSAFMLMLDHSNTALAQNQKTQAKGKTVYIVDGKVVSQADVNAIPVDRIAKMDVLTNVEKVIVVTTSDDKNSPEAKAGTTSADVPSIFGSQYSAPFTVSVADDRVVRVFKGTIENKPDYDKRLYLIMDANGNITKSKTQSITPEQIMWMNIIPGSMAEKFKEYGDISNGVALIRLKPETKVKGKAASGVK